MANGRRRRNGWVQVGCAIAATWSVACSDAAEEKEPPPPCGSFRYAKRTLIPAPGHAGHDPALAAAARKHDRLFAAVSSLATGLNADFSLTASTATASRQILEDFLKDGDGFDLEAAVGESPANLGSWEKSAGLYGGVGLAADAFRYGVLRDGGDACEEIEVARGLLVRGLESADRAARIAGRPGVLVRALANRNLPSVGHANPQPLFDDGGSPIPAEKNNGTWRNDQTGRYAGWIFEDSMSRDMMVGWAMGLAAAWEVVRDDASIDAGLKARLQENARDVAKSLMKIGESGFDLEIIDADGRVTFHGYLNENAFDRLYLPGVDNGFFSVMALGIVGALAYVAEDAEIDRYVADSLVGGRNLAKIASENMLINVGVGVNFSNFNMAFTAIFLAQRYIDDPRIETFLRLALDRELYDKPETDRQPEEMGQSFFDFIYAAGMSGARPTHPGALADLTSVERGLETLRQFPAPPVFDRPRTNCDAAEIAASRCVLDDGTEVRLLGAVGRGEKLVSEQVIPMRVRPPSNFHWRSNPYAPNSDGGAGLRLLPSVDFRGAYWLGRWVEVTR